MTAREFLEWAGYEVNERTLFALTKYVARGIDFSLFPDAKVVTEDGTPLCECAEEPALFQEWMDEWMDQYKEKTTGERPCTCGSGVPWQFCQANSPYCG